MGNTKSFTQKCPPRFITFANRKGGCGKTTTVINIAHAMALEGHRVLIVDMDPQAHASLSLGFSPETDRMNVAHVLAKEITVDKAVLNTHLGNIDLIPASRDLTQYEIQHSVKEGQETNLTDTVTTAREGYDVVIIDPPPTVSLLMISSLVAATEVYIPLQMNFLAMEGLAEMMRLIYLVNATWNPDLRLQGIVPTFFNKNTRLSKGICREIIHNFGKEKMAPAVRTNIKLAEAPGYKQTIFEFDPKSIGAADYRKLAQFILKSHESFENHG